MLYCVSTRVKSVSGYIIFGNLSIKSEFQKKFKNFQKNLKKFEKTVDKNLKVCYLIVTFNVGEPKTALA